MDKAAIAEAKIETLTAKVGCSEAGTNFLKASLDPFSDIGVDCSGYPDRFTGKSVIQRLKREFVIVSPTPDSTTPWDCNIYFDTILTQHNVMDTFVNQNSFQNTAQATPANGTARGGLEVRTASTGGFGMTDTDVVSAAVPSLCLPESFMLNGATRVIGMAFEVVNATAAIARQGTVIVWRDNDNGDISFGVPSKVCTVMSTLAIGLSTNPTSYPMVVAPHIPPTPAAALNLYGSQQWKAEDGCYCVSTLKNDGIPFRVTTQNRVGTKIGCGLGYYQWDMGLPAGQVRFSTTASAGANIFVPHNGVQNVNSPVHTYMHNFNTSGAFFTGLSQTTSLQIIVHYIIERAPNEDNLDLVVLTRRSAGFDPAALELYGRTAGFLPPGTIRKNNDAGDWIKEVAGILQEFGIPGMPLVKGAVTAAQRLYGAWNGNSSQQGQAGMQEADTKVLSAMNAEGNAIRALARKEAKLSNVQLISLSNRMRSAGIKKNKKVVKKQMTKKQLAALKSVV